MAEVFIYYQFITENANDMILVFNKDFNVEYCNEKPLYRILGYNLKEFVGMNGIELVHTDDQNSIKAGFMKGNETGKSAVEARIRHKNGHYIWMEATGRIFTDKMGIKKDIVIARDISNRKKLERKLKESERNFRLITENSDDLIRINSIT